jgi:hypothetical protein
MSLFRSPRNRNSLSPKNALRSYSMSFEADAVGSDIGSRRFVVSRTRYRIMQMNVFRRDNSSSRLVVLEPRCVEISHGSPRLALGSLRLVSKKPFLVCVQRSATLAVGSFQVCYLSL